MNLEAFGFVEVPLVAPLVSVGWVLDCENLEPKKGLDLAEVPFGFAPFGTLESSSWQMKISSQCSSLRIESYVTHNAGPCCSLRLVEKCVSRAN